MLLLGLVGGGVAAAGGLVSAAVLPVLWFAPVFLLVTITITAAYVTDHTAIRTAKPPLYLYAEEGLQPTAFRNFDFHTLDGSIDPAHTEPPEPRR